LETQIIPRAISWPYSEYVRYITAVGNMAPNGTTTIASSNIQLANMPQSIYIFARRTNSQQTFLTSDAFAYITSVNVTIGYTNGKLASATAQDLYHIAVKNGYNAGWNEYSFYNGSVLCLKPGFDLPLDSSTAPGSTGTYNLQINVGLQNVNQSQTINFDLYIVTESEGLFSIVDGVANKQVGPLTVNDVLRAHPQSSVPPSLIKHALHGGNFFGDVWSGIKSVGKAALPIVSSLALPLARKAIGLGRRRRARRRGGAAISSEELREKLQKGSKKPKEIDDERSGDDECSGSEDEKSEN
jgi:hypothetical protein